jgi:hypothetical protein
MSINCSGLKASAVFSYLHNNAKPLRLNGIHRCMIKSITEKEAQLEHLNKRKSFYYVNGIPIHTDYSDYPILKTQGYDREHGDGKMKELINELKWYKQIDR